MQRSIKNRLTGFVLGFLAGCVTMVLYGAYNLWPFQNDIVLHWVRWMSKEAIKWSFIAVVFAIAAFICMQLLNLYLLAREERQKKNTKSGRPA